MRFACIHLFITFAHRVVQPYVSCCAPLCVMSCDAHGHFHTLHGLTHHLENPDHSKRCTFDVFLQDFIMHSASRQCIARSMSRMPLLQGHKSARQLASPCALLFICGLSECMPACILPACRHACMPASMHRCMLACLHACMFAMHGCMDACTHVKSKR